MVDNRWAPPEPRDVPVHAAHSLPLDQISEPEHLSGPQLVWVDPEPRRPASREGVRRRPLRGRRVRRDRLAGSPAARVGAALKRERSHARSTPQMRPEVSSRRGTPVGRLASPGEQSRESTTPRVFDGYSGPSLIQVRAEWGLQRRSSHSPKPLAAPSITRGCLPRPAEHGIACSDELLSRPPRIQDNATRRDR